MMMKVAQSLLPVVLCKKEASASKSPVVLYDFILHLWNSMEFYKLFIFISRLGSYDDENSSTYDANSDDDTPWIEIHSDVTLTTDDFILISTKYLKAKREKMLNPSESVDTLEETFRSTTGIAV